MLHAIFPALLSDSFVMISKYFNIFSMYSEFKMYMYVPQEYYQLMKQYLDEGVPVEGLGVEGHVKLYQPLDATLIWVLTAFSSLFPSHLCHVGLC